VDVLWRAFELRPHPVPSLPADGEYLQKVWTRSVYPLAAEIGLPMKLPPLQPRSRQAHEAAQWARGHGEFAAYNEALFRAFFQHGQDIGDVAVLCQLAEQVGLNGADLEESLRFERFTRSVLRDEAEAAAMRLTGVPAFVVDRKVATSGVQGVESLAELLESARS
jgi:predicted DsbA family dithiol-disulfide isomerase